MLHTTYTRPKLTEENILWRYRVVYCGCALAVVTALVLRLIAFDCE